MSKNRLISLILIPLLLISVAGCGKSENVSDKSAVNHDSEYEFTKVTDYLFETTYDEYDNGFDIAKNYFDKYRPQIGGCSSVQNGQFRGRNYDWTYDDEPEFVIHVTAKDGRHASVGVAATTAISAMDIEEEEFVKMLNRFLDYFESDYRIDMEETNSEIYQMLPYLTLDGINDAGLCVNVNVVNFGEKGEFVMRTEDTADDTCPLMIPRILLDNAGTIEEAIALIEEMDVFSLGTAEECHFMISGKQSDTDDTYNTVVVEFIPDEQKHYRVSVIDYNNGDFVDNKAVMTNFHLTGFDGSVESLTRHPMGYERYLILAENYEQGSTKVGMQDLMKKVYFTRHYDLYKDNYWYSDSAEGDLDMTNTGEPNLKGDASKAGAYASSVKSDAEIYEKNNRDASFWHTVHCSVYDCESKTLSVLPQESGFAYDFAIEQNYDYFE